MVVERLKEGEMEMENGNVGFRRVVVECDGVLNDGEWKVETPSILTVGDGDEYEIGRAHV